jgi:hypothetical protein
METTMPYVIMPANRPPPRISRWEIWLIAACFAVVLLCLALVALHAEGNHNGSAMGGEGGQGGGDYGHTTDYCGSECGNRSVFIGSGRNGPSFSSSHVSSGYASQASRNGF